MSSIHSMIDAMGYFRPRTLLTLDRVAQDKDPMKVLAWRPGPGRAHSLPILRPALRRQGRRYWLPGRPLTPARLD